MQTNQQLIAEYASQEAPLLPLLHAFHERDGYLSEEALRAASDGLKIPIAELFGTVTFYHHLRASLADTWRHASAQASSAA